MVYFDLIGFFFVSYSETNGQIFHIVVPILSVLLSYYFLHMKGISRRNVRKEIRYGFFVTIFSLFLSGLVCYLIATELDYNGKAMSWYNRTYLAIFLYSFPALAVASIFYSQFTRTRDSPLSLALQAQARLNGVNIFWAIICCILTLCGYRTAYVIMIPVLITLIVNTTIGLLKAQNTSEFNDKIFLSILLIFVFHFQTVRKWLYIHLIGQIFIVLWATHFYHLIISVFIPISGRSGGYHNPDVNIAIISAFFTFFVGSYLVTRKSFKIHFSNEIIDFFFLIILLAVSTSWSFEKSHIPDFHNFCFCIDTNQLHCNSHSFSI